MKPKKYFEKTGKIYGIGQRWESGRWNGYAVQFDTWSEAIEWHDTKDNIAPHIKLFASKTMAKESGFYMYINSHGCVIDQGWKLQI